MVELLGYSGPKRTVEICCHRSNIRKSESGSGIVVDVREFIYPGEAE